MEAQRGQLGLEQRNRDYFIIKSAKGADRSLLNVFYGQQ